MSKKKTNDGPAGTSQETMILDFVNKQNRPLSAQNIIDSLQGAVKKGQAEKAIALLAESGQIHCKEYGKSKVFLARQDQFEVPDAAELKKFDDDLQELGEKHKKLTEECKDLNAALRQLSSALTDEEITARTASLRKELNVKESKLAKLKEGAALVTREEKDEAEKQYLLYRDAWRKRRRLCVDAIGMITESSGQKSQEFMEQLGLETDEEAGVQLGQDMISAASRKRSAQGG